MKTAFNVVTLSFLALFSVCIVVWLIPIHPASEKVDPMLNAVLVEPAGYQLLLMQDGGSIGIRVWSSKGTYELCLVGGNSVKRFGVSGLRLRTVHPTAGLGLPDTTFADTRWKVLEIIKAAPFEEAEPEEHKLRRITMVRLRFNRYTTLIEPKTTDL